MLTTEPRLVGCCDDPSDHTEISSHVVTYEVYEGKPEVHTARWVRNGGHSRQTSEYKESVCNIEILLGVIDPALLQVVLGLRQRRRGCRY